MRQREPNAGEINDEHAVMERRRDVREYDSERQAGQDAEVIAPRRLRGRGRGFLVRGMAPRAGEVD